MSERIVSWWIKWNDLNWPDSDNLELIKRRADQMAAADVSAAVVFGAHFRWDFMPFWEILHDYLATVADELHQRKIKLFDHHSVNLIHRYDNREEMRHVITHSGPHLPFSPSRQAAASWEFNGSKLNSWRMIDAETGKVLWYPQYDAEGFCHRNPDFIAAYQEYVKILLRETNIDGLMSDDTVHYRLYHSCACDVCRSVLRERTGVELPIGAASDFWGNWNNPAWKAWIDLRFESARIFQAGVREVLPPDFPLMSCCPGSTSARCNNTGTNVLDFLDGGCNYVHLELCGNTPPYKHDPVTWNSPLSHHFINASHHQAAAQARGVRCYGGGYGFTEPTAGIIWAENKCLGADCWFSTLKGRLGLPQSILDTLPNDAEPVAKAYHFEAGHPELFDTVPMFQVGVYFSYETRKHSYFGNLISGYYRDFVDTLSLLFNSGISVGTVLDIPENTFAYQLLLLPSAAITTAAEQEKLEKFRTAGGVVLATGPCGLPESGSPWRLPTTVAPLDFWKETISPIQWPDWMLTTIPALPESADWRELKPGLHYHPGRLQDGELAPSLLERVRRHMRVLPVSGIQAEGFFTVIHENADQYIIHFLASDYDTDIDHRLDAMRNHRSRVNLITKVEPINTTSEIILMTALPVTAYAPLNATPPEISAKSGQVCITLPPKASYIIAAIDKEEFADV